jgi:virulence factor Mce-like protein
MTSAAAYDSVCPGRGHALVPVRRIARATLVLLAVAAVGVVAGCGVTVEKLPLPKPGVSGDSYQLTAIFDNALNLPNQAKVKVGGSDVGVVTGIKTENFQAIVTMRIRKDVELPRGSTAELRQATPLGDVFVAMSKLAAPPGTPVLRDGDQLPRGDTSAGASVEELLMSVSMLFDGGGIKALAKLVAETDAVIGGKGPQIAHLVTEMTNVIGSLNANTNNVDSVLREFKTTVATLDQRRSDLGNVADTLPQMLGTIAENNQAIGSLLSKLAATSTALTDFSKTSTGSLDTTLASLHTLMNGIAAAGDNVASALDRVHAITPKVNASFRGTTLAVGATITYLTVGLLTDPTGTRLPDGSDVVGLAGSLTQILLHLQQRLRPPPPGQPLPPVPFPAPVPPPAGAPR